MADERNWQYDPILGWVVVGFITLALNEPQDTTEGVLLLLPCLLAWPLLLLGWIVSRPFA